MNHYATHMMLLSVLTTLCDFYHSAQNRIADLRVSQMLVVRQVCYVRILAYVTQYIRVLLSTVAFCIWDELWCNSRKLTLRGALQNKSITSIRQIRYLSCFQLCQNSLSVNGDVWCVHNDTITCIRACPQWSNKASISLIVRKAWEVRNIIS